jgi:hypothetical protein
MQSIIRTATLLLSFIALTGFGSVSLPSVASAADITKNCGGINQSKCSTSKAKYRGKVKKSKPKGAFFDPRKGGEWWKCPSNRPRRTAYPVTHKYACATKRIFGEKLSRAKYMGKTRNKKPKGAFFDLRKGGEYWSCPRGYIRNLNPVTHRAACTIAPKYVCDSGNITMGRKCYKRGACGKSNGRPCQIVERIPSCNRGLAEDFIANKCVKQSVAGCLTVVRAIKVLDSAGKGTDKFAKTFFKTLNLQLPGSKNTKGNANKRRKKAKGHYKKKKNKDKLMRDITSAIKPFKHVVPELKKTAAVMGKSTKALKRLFTNEGFCTASKKQRERAFAKIIPRPKISLKKKASVIDGLFIKSAHAASNTASDQHFYMSYDFSLSAGAGLGFSLGLSFVTDYRGNGGAYFSIGPEVVTNVAAGGGFGLGFWPKVNQGSFAGWGWGVGVSAGPPTKVVSGSVSIFIDENFKDVQGFGFGVGAGAGVSPVDLTFGASHAWKL